MIQSVDRAIRILKALAAGPGRLGVSELSERLGLAKGTVHGLLRTLHEHGLVEQHAKLILSRPAEFRVVDRNEEDMPPKLQAASEAARRGVFENVAAVIQRGVDTGAFHRTDARVAALVILGMCNWTAWWFKPGGRKSEAEIAALIADLAVRSVQAQPGKQAKKPTVPERLQGLRDDLDQIAELMTRSKH